MPILNWSPECPVGCGQPLDVETYAAMYYRKGGPYPDDLIACWEDDAGRVISIDCPQPPGRAYAEAVDHCFLYHPAALGG